VLRGLKHRGMTAPVLAVGDGTLGFWGALAEVFPAQALFSSAIILNHANRIHNPRLRSSATHPRGLITDQGRKEDES
jgi:hypothetical protein